MVSLEVRIDPAAAGFDSRRLNRVGTHLRTAYLDSGRLPGFVLVVTRGGEPVLVESGGSRDLEANIPMDLNTVFRIYSMTKPITAVAALILMEEGRLGLNDPVADHIPSFAGQQVYRSGSSQAPVLEPVTEPMRVWHLFTHMSGLTYGFANAHPVDAIYRSAGFDFGTPKGADLEACADMWASLPLLFQPGTGWAYGVSTDVLGRLVEVCSGDSLDEFFRSRIFDPLGMTETHFWADTDIADRLVALYVPNPADDRRAVRYDPLGSMALRPPTCLSGGGGLVSTAADYQSFLDMLRRRGRDDQRLLSPRTFDLMTANHLPGGGDLRGFGQSMFSETTLDGMGFGLGMATLIDPVSAKSLASAGEFGWGGAASTVFWVDPAEDITALFLTSLLPSSTWPIRTELRQLVYQALAD